MALVQVERRSDGWAYRLLGSDGAVRDQGSGYPTSRAAQDAASQVVRNEIAALYWSRQIVPAGVR